MGLRCHIPTPSKKISPLVGFDGWLVQPLHFPPSATRSHVHRLRQSGCTIQLRVCYLGGAMCSGAIKSTYVHELAKQLNSRAPSTLDSFNIWHPCFWCVCMCVCVRLSVKASSSATIISYKTRRTMNPLREHNDPSSLSPPFEFSLLCALSSTCFYFFTAIANISPVLNLFR